MEPHGPSRSEFRDHVTVITGGGGDIGRACAFRLAERGARLAIIDLDAEKAEAAATELSAMGAEAQSYVCDVTDATGVGDAIEQIASRQGTIRYLFNNAGIQGDFAMTHRYSSEDFARVTAVNVVGTFNVLQSVSARMVQAGGGGAIVMTASMAGVDGPPNMVAYASSKSAVLGMTRTAAKDLAPFAIRVNAISPAFMGPGYMWTRQVERQAAVGSQYYAADPEAVADQMVGAVPMRRYGDIQEIPGVVEFLLSDDASYLTGINVPIAGGI